MPTFDNLNELAAYINKQASKVLKNEVAETTMQEMSETIKEEEYPKYISNAKHPYVRAGDEGGLSDIHNMQVEVIDDNTISIESVRMDGSRDVSEVFALGIGYQWKNSEIYQMQPYPRDFYADTVVRMLKNKSHVEEFKNGMAKLGIIVED